jgi:hypothetical protein
VNVSPCASTPTVPRRSSLACVVAAVAAVAGAVLVPVPVAVRSSAMPAPANSLTLIARSFVFGCVNVTTSPAASATVSVARQMTARTPVVFEPLIASTSTVYTFPFESEHETAPAFGSTAALTSTVLPIGTLTPVARVNVSVVPGALPFAAVPTFFTNVIAAAGEATPSATTASVASAPRRQRTRGNAGFCMAGGVAGGMPQDGAGPTRPPCVARSEFWR